MPAAGAAAVPSPGDLSTNPSPSSKQEPGPTQAALGEAAGGEGESARGGDPPLKPGSQTPKQATPEVLCTAAPQDQAGDLPSGGR